MLEALIFDVDGTLAETEELHRRAFNDTFSAANLDRHWSVEDYRRLLTTTGGKERIARFIAEIGAAQIDIAAMHRAKTDRYTALMAEGGIALRTGIGALIDQARASGLRLVVATTTSRPNVEALALAVWDRPAGEMFEVIAAGDEVDRKKPAPDVYLLALARLGLPAAHCLALEDSRNGLAAARAAGLACVVSPSTYTVGEDFTGALGVRAGFTEFDGISGLNALIMGQTA